MAKAQTLITIDTGPIYDWAERVLAKAGADWLAASQKETPVRKPRDRKGAGDRSQAFRVRLRGTGLTLGQRRLKRSLGTVPSTRAAVIASLQGSARREYAQLFFYTEGPNKGRSPEVVLTRGSRIVGAEVTRGGTLKAGTKLVGPVREGSRVTITLRNDVPYARYVEEGFNHKGGKPVWGGRGKGKRFMRGPRDQMILPALREGRYSKG